MITSFRRKITKVNHVGIGLARKLAGNHKYIDIVKHVIIYILQIIKLETSDFKLQTSDLILKLVI